MRISGRRCLGIVCYLTLDLNGCASLPGDRLADTPIGPLEISEIQGPPPVVVFESGLASYKEVWNKVFPTIAATQAVFAYDRPGVGESPPTSRPRDGSTIVEDLRAVLRSRHAPPPYLLVGHSAGGLYMQLYARRYPNEVIGLVLVDSTHPSQFEGAGSMRQRSALSRFAVAIALTQTAKAELDALDHTGQQVQAAPPLRPDLPIVILSAPDPSDTDIAKFDNDKRADLGRLYPGAIVRQLARGHNVPQVDPQAVIDAINTILVPLRLPPLR